MYYLISIFFSFFQLCVVWIDRDIRYYLECLQQEPQKFQHPLGVIYFESLYWSKITSAVHGTGKGYIIFTSFFIIY